MRVGRVRFTRPSHNHLASYETELLVTYLSLEHSLGRGSGLFNRGRCHSRLQEMKLGLRPSADERLKAPAIQ